MELAQYQETMRLINVLRKAVHIEFGFLGTTVDVVRLDFLPCW